MILDDAANASAVIPADVGDRPRGGATEPKAPVGKSPGHPTGKETVSPELLAPTAAGLMAAIDPIGDASDVDSVLFV